MPAQTRNAKRQHNSALLGDLICHDDILESILKIGAPQDGVNLIVTCKELYNLDMSQPGPNKVVTKWLWEVGKERKQALVEALRGNASTLSAAKRKMLSKQEARMISYEKAVHAMRWIRPQKGLLLGAPSAHGGSRNANTTDLVYKLQRQNLWI